MLLGVVAGLLTSCPARAGQGDGACGAAGAAVSAPEPGLALRNDWRQEETPAELPEEAPSTYRRYAMLVMANAYPGLKSEDLINNIFDPLMGAIAPGIEQVNTFGDMRDNCLLWVPNVGGGYNISRHFSLFLTLGYGAGPVTTEDDQRSIFLLPLHLYFKMKRSAFTVTPGVDYFPFGMVEQRDYHGLMDRLRASRPMLGVRVPWTHAGYKADVKLGLGPVEKLIDIHLEDTWRIWSVNLNVGMDVPVNRRNQVNVNIGRSIFFAHDDDFGGTVFSITWKHLF
jgi:hypothetical protein